MATVFKKWLETSPEDNDRGIQLLTLGRIATTCVYEGARVLEDGEALKFIGERQHVHLDSGLCGGGYANFEKEVRNGV